LKNYLLTWYGITDLEAAFGIEKSDGPILRVLKTGNYTDVLILGYTKKDKVEPTVDSKPSDLSNCCELIESYLDEVEQKLEDKNY